MAPYGGNHGSLRWTLWLLTMDTMAPYGGHYGSLRWTSWLLTVDTMAPYGGHCGSLRWTLWLLPALSHLSSLYDLRSLPDLSKSHIL
jgi:hypothetical protein